MIHHFAQNSLCLLIYLFLESHFYLKLSSNQLEMEFSEKANCEPEEPGA